MMGFLLAVLLARLITAGVNSFGELRNLVEAFLPFILIWLVVAPFVGLFRPTIAFEIDQLWRVGALVPICVLVAYWLGSLWNEQPLTTVFAIAMTLISTPLLVGLRYLVIRLGSGKV
jgi:predicted membrane protein